MVAFIIYMVSNYIHVQLSEFSLLFVRKVVSIELILMKKGAA